MADTPPQKMESGYVVQMRSTDRWLTHWYTARHDRGDAIYAWQIKWGDWDWVKERDAKQVRCVKVSVSLED